MNFFDNNIKQDKWDEMQLIIEGINRDPDMDISYDSKSKQVYFVAN